jgi:3-phosphoshikimate 1-carboxyvinyltransferase
VKTSFSSPPDTPLDLGNSGTGLRLLLGLLAGQPFSVVLTGDASLRRRPVERVLEPLRSMGARAEAEGDHAPVSLTGGRLRGIRHSLPVPSAQVKSALLLAGVQAEGRTTVERVGASRDHTERMLPGYGVPVETGEDSISVWGPAELLGTTVVVPGDPSAASFYLAAVGVVPGSEVILEQVSLNSSRTRVFDVFGKMGFSVTQSDPGESLEPMGRVAARGEGMTGFEIGPAEITGLIDELPALAVAAAFTKGTSRVRGAAELRVKESDRLEAMANGLAAIGAAVELHEDGWTIEGSGGERLPGGTVESQGDHRIAMAFLVAGLGCKEGVTIADEPMIETSDPLFPANLERLVESSE